CSDVYKGVFLLNHGPDFHCPRCRRMGLRVPEKGWKENDCPEFKTVRIEYNYSAESKIYRDSVVLTDTSIWGERNTFNIQSPLIKTEKRATRVATTVLANLMHEPEWSEEDGCIPKTTETIISFDKPLEEFKFDLNSLRTRLEKSTLLSVE
ncbi:MAG: hypothetical protein ACXABY_16795, partial [Candidatus Thorarchaeota archaeon]